MIQLMGGLLLFCGSTAIGLGAAGALRKRTQALSSFLGGLTIMEAELQFHLTPMPDLLEKLAREAGGAAGAFFALCRKGLGHLEDTPLSLIWQEALQSRAGMLTEGDREVLEQLGAILGRYDLEGQLSAIGAAKQRLEECRRQAETRQTTLGRMYSVLGMTAGIMSVLLLI